VAQLSVIHVNPKVSNPKRLETIPKTPVNDEEGVEDLLEGDEMDVDGVHEVEDVDIEADGWAGIRKEIGILTEKDFQTVMAKCLRTMGTPVGGSIASAAAGALSPMDTMASQTILQMRKPTNRLLALAEIIVYSMAEDSPAKSGSSLATPGESTPVPAALKRVKASANGLHPSSSTDSLADAGRRADASKTYLAGSKSLEHLAKLIVSCESFFHPSNHGQWTQILAVFIQDLAWQFTARWKAEESSSCKTPPEWRLTSDIRREFVLVLRPVALMSIFAKDGISAGASRSCLRSLSVLEPELIVPAIVERAIPSLTNLEETARTAAVIRTLGDVSWAMVSRHVSKSGPSQIPGILELVLAGIDMNDPQKTTSTVLFLMGILQHIRLEQLPEESPEGVMAGPRNPEPRSDLAVERKEGQEDQPMASPEEEDMYFRQATTGFSAWITDFLGRIFQLYDNMPEEGEGRSLKAGVSQEERTVALVNVRTSNARLSQ
jgi:proteasome activator subunit 4